MLKLNRPPGLCLCDSRTMIWYRSSTKGALKKVNAMLQSDTESCVTSEVSEFKSSRTLSAAVASPVYLMLYLNS
jgi:hypothetical protein